jgi:hypothetical protein
LVLAMAAESQLSLIEESLVEKYSGRVEADAVHELVFMVAESLRDARIKAYVPLLIQRGAEDGVRQLVGS